MNAKKERRRAQRARWRAKNPGRSTRDEDLRRKTTLRGRIRHLLASARRRSREREWVCDITIDDLIIPEICPVLGIPLGFTTDTPLDNRLSIDRTDNTKGYVKGNVRLISYRANTIKNSMTLDECRALLAYLETQAELAQLYA